MHSRLVFLLAPVAFTGLFHPLAAASPQRGTTATPALMSPADLQSLPARPADHRVAYGDDATQFAELRLPSGAGPHPVVVLVHGGCWKAQYASLRDLAPMGGPPDRHPGDRPFRIGQSAVIRVADRTRGNSLAAWQLIFCGRRVVRWPETMRA